MVNIEITNYSKKALQFSYCNAFYIVFLCKNINLLIYLFAVIYPSAVNNSAISTAPPAAPRKVLCDNPTNL